MVTTTDQGWPLTLSSGSNHNMATAAAAGQSGHHPVEPHAQVAPSERGLGHQGHAHDEGHVGQQVGDVARGRAGDGVQVLVVEQVDEVGRRCSARCRWPWRPRRPAASACAGCA